MMYVFRRTCGFGSDNTYKNKLLVADKLSPYNEEACYQYLGAAQGLSYTQTSFVDSKNEDAVLQAVQRSVQPRVMNPMRATAAMKDDMTDSRKAGWIGEAIGNNFGGSIEFGAKRKWLPFAVAGIVLVAVVVGVKVIT